jgi:hypothetical protein
MAGFLRSDAKRTYCFARALAVLAEQARNRDHHSSDPRGQASKQQKVAQEKRHTPASPITSPVQGYVDIPTYFLGSMPDSRTITNYFAAAGPATSAVTLSTCGIYRTVG